MRWLSGPRARMWRVVVRDAGACNVGAAEGGAAEGARHSRPGRTAARRVRALGARRRCFRRSRRVLWVVRGHNAMHDRDEATGVKRGGKCAGGSRVTVTYSVFGARKCDPARASGEWTAHSDDVRTYQPVPDNLSSCHPVILSSCHLVGVFFWPPSSAMVVACRWSFRALASSSRHAPSAPACREPWRRRPCEVSNRPQRQAVPRGRASPAATRGPTGRQP